MQSISMRKLVRNLENLIVILGIVELLALQNKQTEFERYKAFNDRTVDYDKFERKLNETLGLLAQKEIDIKEGLKVKANEISIIKEKHDELVKQSLLTKSHYEGLVKEKTKNDSFTFVNDLKKEMHADLKYVESLEDEIDELESNKAEFSNMYDMLLQECVSNDIMYYYLQSSSDQDRITEYNAISQNFAKLSKQSISLEIALQQCQEQLKNDTVCKEKASNVFQKEHEQYFESSTARQEHCNKIPKPSVLGKPAPFSNSLERTNFAKKKSVSKTNESEGLSKPVTPQNLPQTATQAVRNTNVIKPGMYRIVSSTIQTRAPQLTQTSKNTNPHVSTSTRVAQRTNVSRPQPRSNQMKDKVLSNNRQVKFKKTEVEDHLRISRISNQTKSVIASNDSLNSRTSNVNSVCATCGKCTVRFGNNQFSPILGYGDLVQGNITINRVYYVEGLNHNSFSELVNSVNVRLESNTVPSSKGRLNWLHMDLCGPMRVATINGKRYILVIVDDYSRYTWTLFLRSKDETPKVLKDFLTMIQRNLQAPVISVRTDRGTEFLNKTLNAFFNEEGIKHQISTPRTPEQNGVVERQNRTLVEVARMMLSASKLPLFFWAEVIATACYTQNRLIIIPTHEKTAYHIINDRKPSIKHFHIFGCTCYLTRDGENLDKMKEKGDPCILVGYSTQSKGYRVYNKRTRLIVESIHLRFDERSKSCLKTSVLMELLGLVPQDKASDYDNPDPAPELQNVSPSANTTVPSQQELDLLFGPLYDEFFNAGTSRVNKTDTTPTNVHAEENNDNQAEFTNPFCTPGIQENAESSSRNIVYCHLLNLDNLFSVGQFCDADLEVAFRKSTCFVRDLQGNDLLTGNRGSDLYTISLQETTSSTPICLMAKASPTQAWLWHRRLSHLNFDYINLLSKKDVVIGLPKLKYVKDQLCSSCEVSKAKRSSFKTKTVPSSKGRLNLLHMDLCGPMRVASINGKKYILVIVDDYSRYTWTLFLCSKDETPEVLKDFLTMIQRNLQAPVISVRTDRGTEFLNKTLNAFFKEEGIEHQTSTPRTPEQNGVVER
ncbi:retrovirus-related pol polyprotein from transposon TNT 1-94 [Tanacetum coccineum]